MSNKKEMLKILYDMKHDWKVWIHIDKPFNTELYKNINKLQKLIGEK